MMMNCILLVTLLTLAGSAVAESSWPAWRGPAGNGVSPDGDPPIEWSESSNIRFKVEIPGNGLAAPIVWKDRVFVLTAVAVDEESYEESQAAAAGKSEAGEWPPSVEPVKQQFKVLALSRKDGSLLWERVAAETQPHESHYLDASWASASPVTDGKRLIAHFGSNGTFAYDLDGKLLWAVDLGDMTTRNGFGEGSSPVLYEDRVVINWDHEGDSFLVTLDAGTGEIVWKVDRPDEVTSWSTPLVLEVAGKPQIVVAATGKSRGYDLKSGRELWSLGGMTVNAIPTPVYRDGVVYLTSGFRGNMLQAVSLADAGGALEDSEALLWTHDRHTPYVPSPVLLDDGLYFLKQFKNIFTQLDASSGEVRYTEQRLPGIHDVYASPVAAAGRIYVFDKDGHAVVVKHGIEFEVLAQNELDEGVDASPAIAGDELFVRGRRHLYCIAAD
jgi:outer membrane protein assembly factor BamB